MLSSWWARVHNEVWIMLVVEHTLLDCCSEPSHVVLDLSTAVWSPSYQKGFLNKFNADLLSAHQGCDVCAVIACRCLLNGVLYPCVVWMTQWGCFGLCGCRPKNQIVVVSSSGMPFCNNQRQWQELSCVQLAQTVQAGIMVIYAFLSSIYIFIRSYSKLVGDCS